MRSDPIDLTTLGAATPLPPADHPLWDGPVKTASEINEFDLTGMDPALAQFLQRLTARMSVLEWEFREWKLYQSAPWWKRLLMQRPKLPQL